MPITKAALLAGASTPTLFVSGTTSANKVLIPTPTKGYIEILAFQFQNEDSTAGTLVARNGSNEWWRVRGQNQGDGCGYPTGPDLNEGLDVNVTVSGGVWGYGILYRVVI